MRRAVSEGQKEQRREALLDAAWAMFQERPYEEVAIQEVARAAGVAKGTFYLYFPTKEELFLVLCEREAARWIEAVEAGLLASGGVDPATAAAQLSESLAARPALARLLAICHLLLERNVAYESIVRFKRATRAMLLRAGALIAAGLGWADPAAGARLLLRVYALIIGVQQLADPAPLARAALEREPDLALFAIELGPELRAAIEALIRGQR